MKQTDKILEGLKEYTWKMPLEVIRESIETILLDSHETFAVEVSLIEDHFISQTIALLEAQNVELEERKRVTRDWDTTVKNNCLQDTIDINNKIIKELRV